LITTLWSIQDSKYIYGIGKNDLYFLDVDGQGRLVIHLENLSISFPELIERARSLSQNEFSSFNVRIPAFAAERAVRITAAFRNAMKQSKYEGKYQPVFPIKVNHHYDIVRAVLATDPSYGLEAGSKGEFLLIRNIVGQDKSRFLICNGTKDIEYLKMAMDAHNAGHGVIVTLESPSDVQLVAKCLPDGGIPLGLRIKPYVESSGHWAAASGRQSKFGMAAHDLLEVINILRTNNLKKDVWSIHAHIGSQVADPENARDLARFMTEAYWWLTDKQTFTALRFVDLGGGLPVDYEGTKKDGTCEAFATTIVESVKDTCTKLGVKRPPTLLTETGRAIAAHSSMVLVKVLDQRGPIPASETMTPETANDVNKWLKMARSAKSLAAVLRVWSRLNKELGDSTGDIDELHRRDQILAWVKGSIRKKVIEEGLVERDGTVPGWLIDPELIAYGNFSVFNSCIDHVLADQYFPVIPVAGLDKQPETTVRIADITCDSDGEISAFVRRERSQGVELASADGRPLTGMKNSITVGIPIPSTKTLRGSFFLVALTGAYQEVMASDPNLMGRLPDVVVAVRNGQVHIAWKRGDAGLASKLGQYGVQAGSFEPYSVGDEKE